MTDAPIRYESDDEDSARWLSFPFRDGDIVISTRSKSGTTWMQMICALLVFQSPGLPAPLATLSPWLDWTIASLDEVVGRLETQAHRRLIKTHIPLDGVPIDAKATYIVVGRDPRDAFISPYHQSRNIDRVAVARLFRQPRPGPGEQPPERLPLAEALQAWIDGDASPQQRTDSIRGVFHHATDAWQRRDGRDNVIPVHYSDLLRDLEGEMRGLADRLGIRAPDERWPELVDAATFATMRRRAAAVVPDRRRVLKDVAAFFRRGTSGVWAEVMTDDQARDDEQRVAGLAPADVVAWLHR